MNVSGGDISSVLNQIRQLQGRQSSADIKGPDITPAPQGAGAFGDLMANALNKVNSDQQQAASSANAFTRGDESMDLSQVMLSLNQAQVSFKAMAEVRNRLVSSYQDIMNMPI